LAARVAALHARGGSAGLVGRRLALRQAALSASTPAASTTSTSSTTSTDTETGDGNDTGAHTCDADSDGGGAVLNDTQLKTDLNTLRTDLNGVIAGSGATDAQRLALRSDLRAVRDANTSFMPDRKALGAVADSLLTAIADGTYDSDSTVADSIKTSFTNVFSGSNIDSSLIDQTYADFVAVARGLNISSDELKTLANDRAAIQADLTRLGIDTSTGHSVLYSSSNLDLILGGGPRGFGRGPGDLGEAPGGFGGRHFGRFR
jgi:hypothetical protein